MGLASGLSDGQPRAWADGGRSHEGRSDEERWHSDGAHGNRNDDVEVRTEFGTIIGNDDSRSTRTF